MKLLAVFGTLALSATANAAVTATCTPGLNYCSGVLEDVGSNGDAIEDALRRYGLGNNSGHTGLWPYYVFHCNNDHTLTVVEHCQLGCLNHGKGQNDSC
ncbi:hypothetical protein BO85DRAFT_519620 [Aspergillus piperis CBS 112811]|uniref:Uncharacterized protein n=1 Tax=Aspergillus piperis CBS 112811 TaxID=1448313 RepID=A0A8G1VNP3_9EURO|nr:hypothetical protein BO85DRAFT_519620 [Aspergillus piperis CBS 112811]RAH58807.1 hypothetical protein BO85DRAFT_519620 [Aspergillus piperis CBS 112811]